MFANGRQTRKCVRSQSGPNLACPHSYYGMFMSSITNTGCVRTLVLRVTPPWPQAVPDALITEDPSRNAGGLDWTEHPTEARAQNFAATRKINEFHVQVASSRIIVCEHDPDPHDDPACAVAGHDNSSSSSSSSSSGCSDADSEASSARAPPASNRDHNWYWSVCGVRAFEVSYGRTYSVCIPQRVESSRGS